MDFIKLPKETWREFFEEMTRHLRGRLVEVEVIGPDVGDAIEVQGLPFAGISYNPTADELQLHTDPELAGVEHWLRRPNEIHVDIGADGLRQVVLIDADRRMELIRLRTPLALPEGTLRRKGLAPPPPARGIRAPGLKAGDRAPPFALPASPEGKKVSIEDCRGAPLVLIFYPADFTPVCSSELSLFNELRGELERLGGARALGISVDSASTHIAFAGELNLQLPLLSDFHPKGEVSRAYRVYREEDGFSERALFVIDDAGVIFWSHVSPLEVNPGADGVVNALERLTGLSLSADAAAEVQS